MMDVREQIEDYFKLMGLKYTWNSVAHRFELGFTERKDERPASPTVEDEATFRYTVNVEITDKWVQVYCDVYELEKVPADRREAVLIDLLSLNRKYAEVCYDYDPRRGMIGTSQEMLVQGLNFDLFRDEFMAVPWAVKRFWVEIAATHGLE